MITLRATKYDPRHRNAQDVYTHADFTSCFDIGKELGHKVVSAETYIRIEDAYVACVRRLCEAGGSSSLMISELEDRRDCSKVLDELQQLRPAACGILYDGMVVEMEGLDSIVRMALREELWCKLLGSNSLYVHFGHDYYMYIGGAIKDGALGTPPCGTFYEVMESPYH